MTELRARVSRAVTVRNNGGARWLVAGARWFCGMVWISWCYLWFTIPLHRTEERGDSTDLPPSLGHADVPEGIKRLHTGVGGLLHRLYRVRIACNRLDPEQLLSAVADDPNRVAPREVAFFVKSSGHPESFRTGDEYVVRMPGPWDGPVRVVHRAPESFRLATLPGHLEAGQIEFRATERDGELVFEIESWARAGDVPADVLYDHLRLAKEMQLNMWTRVCLRAARLAGGRPHGGVRIHTRRVPSRELGRIALGHR